MIISTTATSDRMPLHEQITQALRTQIRQGVLKADEPLPSYRKLMADYGVTVGTIRQAIRSLQDQGLVYSVPGIGCKVRSLSESGRIFHMGVAVVGKSEMIWLIHQMARLQHELDERQMDLVLRFVPQTDEASVGRLIQWAKRMDGVLLCGHVTLDVAERLVAGGVRALQLGELLDGPCPRHMSQITIDVEATIALAVSHLASLGHRHIALCLHDMDSRYYNLLASGYVQMMKAHGLPHENMIHRGIVSSHDYVQGVMAWMKSRQIHPTAMIVEEGVRASQLVGSCQEQGIRVPQDLSVVSITSDTSLPRIRKEMTSVLTSGQKLAMAAIDAIGQACHSEVWQVRVEKIVSTFSPGVTSGMAGTVSISAGD